MENLARTNIETIADIMNRVIVDYELNEQVIRDTEGELMDLEHEIELSEARNAAEGYKLYKDLRDTRIRRRKAKNENAVMKELYQYFKSNDNFKRGLKNVRSQVIQAYNTVENQEYKPPCKKKFAHSTKTIGEIMKTKINLETMSDALALAAITSELAGSITITDGNGYRVNAKSVVGAIYSLEFDSLWLESENDIYSSVKQFVAAE